MGSRRLGASNSVLSTRLRQVPLLVGDVTAYLAQRGTRDAPGPIVRVVLSDLKKDHCRDATVISTGVVASLITAVTTTTMASTASVMLKAEHDPADAQPDPQRHVGPGTSVARPRRRWPTPSRAR
jgi:hypothetical protein